MRTPTRHQFPPSQWPFTAAVSWLLFGAFVTWVYLSPSRHRVPPTAEERVRWLSVCAAGLLCLLPFLVPVRCWAWGWRFAVGVGLLALWVGTGLAVCAWIPWSFASEIARNPYWDFDWASLVWLAAFLCMCAVFLIAFWLRPAWLIWERLRNLRQDGSEGLREVPADWEEAPCAATPGE